MISPLGARAESTNLGLVKSEFIQPYAVLQAGGTDDGPPGIRDHYDPGYYAAFVIDPDGHRLEAVFHEPY